MAKENKQGPSMSKSALLLSPCLAWAHPKAKWYDEKYTDTSDRDLGTEFHRLIDGYLKGTNCAGASCAETGKTEDSVQGSSDDL